MSEKVRIVFRSAITGRFVTRDYAVANPRTTIKETIKLEQA